MKKNILMRIGSTALVLTMITSYIISGTYAKYITSDSASDTARVAKFGVVVTATGSLFDKTYLTGTNTPGGSADKIAVSVESTGRVDKVVAPGTKNTDGITFVIDGTAETDVKVQVDVTQNNDIFLASGEYNDHTTGATDKFNNADDYYPLKFTLTQKKDSGSPTPLVNAGKLSEVVEKLKAITASIDADTDLGTKFGTYKLTWEWSYGTEGTTVDDNDRQDTLLGKIASGEETTVGASKYKLEENLAFKITVVQID